MGISVVVFFQGGDHAFDAVCYEVLDVSFI